MVDNTAKMPIWSCIMAKFGDGAETITWKEMAKTLKSEGKNAAIGTYQKTLDELGFLKTTGVKGHRVFEVTPKGLEVAAKCKDLATYFEK